MKHRVYFNNFLLKVKKAFFFLERSNSKNGELNKYFPLIFTLIFILILTQYSFPSIESFLYDIRLQLDLGIKNKSNIVLITLDEESDTFLGEKFPYTYSTHAKFIKELIKDKPSVISFLIPFQNPDSVQEINELKRFKTTIESYNQNGGSFRFGTFLIEGFGEQWPPEQLRELGHSLAILHIDSTIFSKDAICRRAILNISGDDSLHLWIANSFRKKNNLSELIPKNIHGSYYSKEADATFTLFRYFTNPEFSTQSPSKLQKIPYHKVIVGNFPSGFFKDKIILIGPEYISKSSDFILTPFNRDQEETNQVSAISVHAEIIESLIQNKTISELPRIYTNLICFFLAFLLSFLNSKASPSKGLLINITTIFSLLLISFFLFSFFGTWIYLTHLILTVLIIYYIWVPFRAIAEYQTRYAIEEESKILKEVDHLKQNFISLMSHDLKTPVAKIAGNADILMNFYPHHEKIRDHLKNIQDATKELNNFITAILDLMKVESQHFNLRIIQKDINNIIEDLIYNFRFEANLKAISIETHLSPLYPISIDVDLVKRILSNIIENALKYSGKGSLIIVKTWDDEKWVYIQIQDNGVGMSKENLDHIFDKFYRIKNDASHSIKGFGLGLYLVKYFVELHGGKISVESELGVNTSFLIQFKNK